MRRPIFVFIVICFLSIGCKSIFPQQQPGGATLPSNASQQQTSQAQTPALAKDSPPTLTPQALKVLSQLAWFYKPPSNVDIRQVAENFEFFIMTYGNETERDKLALLNPQAPMLEYLRFEAIHDPADCTRQPLRNQVAYRPGDYCRIQENHPDWFLLDERGHQMVNYMGKERYVLMDPGNKGWQTFWLERAMEVQGQPGWDGVFLDNVEISLYQREQEPYLPTAYPDSEKYEAAVQSFLKFLSETYFKPNHKLLYANLVARGQDENWDIFMQHLDGAMYESWVLDKTKEYRSTKTWERHLNIAENTQAQGKIILLISQGQQDQNDLQQFAYASYLLVNQGRAIFRYANSDVYREAWLYPNYNLDLGQPLGPRYLVDGVWRRDFTNGQVEVDPNQHTSRITEK